MKSINNLVYCRLLRLFLTVAGLAVSGCERQDVEGEGAQDSEISVNDPVGLAQACTACHRLPPAEALPASEWPTVIDQMVGLAAESTSPLHVADILAAHEFYLANSPETLTRPAPVIVDDDTELWSVTSFTPPGLEGTLLPAVSHVQILQMADGEPLSLLASEMRSRTLLHLPFEGDPNAAPALYPVLRGLNYPARIEPFDWNQDGLTDLIFAEMGSLHPNNATEGTVMLATQLPGRRFDRSILSADLGRPSDICAADFDGDGDQDIAFSAFGLYDPGQLAVLENAGLSSSSAPEMPLHVLDDRDGFTSVAAVDMDDDGAIDIVALLAQQHEELLLFRNEGGLRFTRHVIWKAPHPSWAFSHMEVRDVNGDGLPDVITTNGDSLDYDVVKPYSGVQLFENLGKVGFKEMKIGSMPGAASCGIADIDGDGDQDIAASVFMPLSSPAEWIERDLASIAWFENLGANTGGAGSWRQHTVERTSLNHPTLVIADCDGDGLRDIVVGNYVWIDEEKGPLFRSPYISIYSRSSP